MSTYQIGDIIHFTNTFTHALGGKVNPTSPILVLSDPNDVVADINLINLDTGDYYVDWTVPTNATIGSWNFYFQGYFDSQTNQSSLNSFTIATGGNNIGGATIGNLTSHALSTVPNAKVYLNIPSGDTSNDNWLVAMINGLSASFENFCSRHFEYLTFTNQLYNATGRQYMIVKHRPIDVNANITITVDTDPPMQPYDPVNNPDGYIIETSANGYDNAGTIYCEVGWPNGFLSMYRGLQSGDMHPFAVRKNVSISYSGGYVLPKDATMNNPQTLPAEIEMCLWKEIGRSYTQRLAEGMKRQHVPVGFVAEYINVDLLPETKAVLTKYKEVFF